MALSKKLETGTIIRTWNFDEVTTSGQTISVKNKSSGGYNPLIHIESVKCAEGIKDRIVIKKSVIKEFGFIVIEE